MGFGFESCSVVSLGKKLAQSNFPHPLDLGEDRYQTSAGEVSWWKEMTGRRLPILIYCALKIVTICLTALTADTTVATLIFNLLMRGLVFV